MSPMYSSETSVTIYQSTLSNITEERRSYLHPRLKPEVTQGTVPTQTDKWMTHTNTESRHFRSGAHCCEARKRKPNICTQRSSNGKANSSSATQRTPPIIRNRKFHCRFHNSQPFVFRSQSTYLSRIILRYILILSSHLRLGLPSYLLSPDPQHVFFSCTLIVLHPRPSHPS
jgi:hypothetical protein